MNKGEYLFGLVITTIKDEYNNLAFTRRLQFMYLVLEKESFEGNLNVLKNHPSAVGLFDVLTHEYKHIREHAKRIKKINKSLEIIRPYIIGKQKKILKKAIEG